MMATAFIARLRCGTGIVHFFAAFVTEQVFQMRKPLVYNNQYLLTPTAGKKILKYLCLMAAAEVLTEGQLVVVHYDNPPAVA
jgi:hypothetical protein